MNNFQYFFCVGDEMSTFMSNANGLGLYIFLSKDGKDAANENGNG